jgi:hypothetical protein
VPLCAPAGGAPRLAGCASVPSGDCGSFALGEPVLVTSAAALAYIGCFNDRQNDARDLPHGVCAAPAGAHTES